MRRGRITRERVLRYLTPLAAATALLIGGAAQYAEAQTVTGIALLTAGILTLGVWIGVEVSKRIPEDQIELEDEELQ